MLLDSKSNLNQSFTLVSFSCQCNKCLHFYFLLPTEQLKRKRKQKSPILQTVHDWLNTYSQFVNRTQCNVFKVKIILCQARSAFNVAKKIGFGKL